MEEIQNEKQLMDYLDVIWKRRWLIAVPAFLCAVIVGIWSFALPPTWEINAIIQPGKFVTQTQAGQFEEVSVVEAKQIAGQINQEAYNPLIAAELNLDLRKFPKLNAENLKDTKLIKVSLKSGNVQTAKDILRSLFESIKKDLDKKIDVEMKSIDAQIANIESAIKTKNLDINTKNLDIQSNGIDKAMLKRDIASCQNKLIISEERAKSILDEMKTAKTRIEDIDQQQKKALSEKKEGAEALGLLLYSNEIQQNLRYYNSLEGNLSSEKITQENLKLAIEDKEKSIKQLSNQVEKLKNDIENLKNDIENLKNTITLMNGKKGRIDYTILLKEPTSSLDPVSPQKKKNVLIAGLLSLMTFTILAFFIEYVQQQKSQRQK